MNKDIYNSDYLRQRAEQVVLRSIEELKLVSDEDARQLASDALKDAENNNCADMDYIDALYLATL